MDYNAEKNSLKQARDWWKPTAGKHAVKILTEPESFEIEWEDQTIQKVRLDVEVNGSKFAWGVRKGQTENSLYGQLILIGAEKGKLKDETITLIVKGTGKDVDYTIEEALALMTPKEETVK